MILKTWLFRALIALHAVVVLSLLIALPAAVLWPRTQPFIVTFFAILGAAWVLWWGDCPLTAWERRLRTALNRPQLSGGFVVHNLKRLTGISLSERMHYILQFSYVAAVVTAIIVA